MNLQRRPIRSRSVLPGSREGVWSAGTKLRRLSRTWGESRWSLCRVGRWAVKTWNRKKSENRWIKTKAPSMYRHADIWRCCRCVMSAVSPLYIQQYLLIKAATQLFCTKCMETQVSASSLIEIIANYLSCSLRHSALRLHQVVRNMQTAAQSSQ